MLSSPKLHHDHDLNIHLHDLLDFRHEQPHDQSNETMSIRLETRKAIHSFILCYLSLASMSSIYTSFYHSLLAVPQYIFQHTHFTWQTLIIADDRSYAICLYTFIFDSIHSFVRC